MPKLIDLTGETFGELKVIEKDQQLTKEKSKHFPIHCINGTTGAEIHKDIISAIEEVAPYTSYIDKQTFGILNLDRFVPMKENVEIFVAGVCTDICVISNTLILKAMYSEGPISLLENCCAGSTPENHKAAIQVMSSCLVNMVKEKL